MEDKFITELRNLINRHSKENGSDTPDFILAQYMDRCLRAFEQATREREKWYGRERKPVAPEDYPNEHPTQTT